MRHLNIPSLLAFLTIALIATHASAQQSNDDDNNNPRQTLFFDADAEKGAGPGEIDIEATLIDNTLFVTGKVTKLSSPILENNTSKNGVHLFIDTPENDHDRVFPLEFSPTNNNETRGAIGGRIDLTDDEIQQLRNRQISIDIHTEQHPDGEVSAPIKPD